MCCIRIPHSNPAHKHGGQWGLSGTRPDNSQTPTLGRVHLIKGITPAIKPCPHATITANMEIACKQFPGEIVPCWGLLLALHYMWECLWKGGYSGEQFRNIQDSLKTALISWQDIKLTPQTNSNIQKNNFVFCIVLRVVLILISV